MITLLAKLIIYWFLSWPPNSSCCYQISNTCYYNVCFNYFLRWHLFGLYSHQHRPSVDRLPPIPPPIFKSQKGFFLVIYDSFHRWFLNTATFSSVPRSAVLGGTTVDNMVIIERVWYNSLIDRQWLRPLGTRRHKNTTGTWGTLLTQFELRQFLYSVLVPLFFSEQT